jgi:hypothetical protein
LIGWLMASPSPVTLPKVWETRTMTYVVPTTVRWIQIVTEDWSGGLPDNPALWPVFFDVIELSTDPTPVRRCEDPDHDVLCSGHDNCPQVPNPVQPDLDHDGKGDACDPD